MSVSIIDANNEGFSTTRSGRMFAPLKLKVIFFTIVRVKYMSQIISRLVVFLA